MATLFDPAPPWMHPRSEVLTVWHGCTELDRQNIERVGIDLQFSRWETDFSRGFYTTTLKRQADHWAVRRADDRTVAKTGNQPVVLRFNLSRIEISAFHTLHFVLGDYECEDFWSFVQHCRQGRKPAASSKKKVRDHAGPVSESDGRWYDIVAGPVVANWRQRATLAISDQFSFHTVAAVGLLNQAIRSGDEGRYKWQPIGQ